MPMELSDANASRGLLLSNAGNSTRTIIAMPKTIVAFGFLSRRCGCGEYILKVTISWLKFQGGWNVRNISGVAEGGACFKVILANPEQVKPFEARRRIVKTSSIITIFSHSI